MALSMFMIATGPIPTSGGSAAAPAPNMLAGFLLAGGILMIVFTLLRMLRKRARATPPPMDTEVPSERLEKLRAEARARETVDTLAADATELTQRLAAQLENKAARLEKLIAEADERLAKLDAAEAPASTRFSRPEPAEVPVRSGLRDTPPAHARVFELADRGLPTVEIAKELGQPTGQVELILALRRSL